ncbi:unnamed protein product, partial [marine sediment metagenome]
RVITDLAPSNRLGSLGHVLLSNAGPTSIEGQW